MSIEIGVFLFEFFLSPINTTENLIRLCLIVLYHPMESDSGPDLIFLNICDFKFDLYICPVSCFLSEARFSCA